MGIYFKDPTKKESSEGISELMLQVVAWTV